MKTTFKINYNNFIDKLFLIYICFFYAFPYQILKVELILLSLILLFLRRIKLNIFLLWSILYVIILLFSILYSINPGSSLTKALQVLKSLLFANLLISSINYREEIERIFKYFIFSGFVLIGRILSVFPISEIGKSRIHIPGLFNSNDIGLKLSISLLCVLYFLVLKRKKNILFYFELIMLYSFSIFTGSRTAFLFASLEIVILLLVTIKNRIKLLLVLFIIIMSIYLFGNQIINLPIVYNTLGKRLNSFMYIFSKEGRIDESSIIRINMIRDGITYFLKKPFLGYGVDNYRYLSHYQTYSHNNYIELLVGLGIFGTIVYYFSYIFILFKSFIEFFKGRKEIVIFIILIFLLLIVDFGTVSYYERYNIFILAFSFLGIETKNYLKEYSK